MSSKRDTEIKLVDQLRRGNEAAFVSIYNTYWKLLFNSGYKRLAKREIVEGLVQEVFVELWQKKITLQIHTSLEAYLLTAMKYRVFNHYKAQYIKDKYVEFVVNKKKSFGSEVEDKLFYNELDNALRKEVDQLPPQAKKVYQLKNGMGLSYAEIANELDISISTVEKHMIKALKILRTNLKDYSLSIGLTLYYSLLN